MPDAAPDSDELLLHMDIDGFAALLKAVEDAMVEGRGHLPLRLGCGLIATAARSQSRFARVTVTFGADSRDRDRDPEPQPQPREPVLEPLH